MKSERLIVRLTLEEKEMLEAICKHENRRFSEQIVHFVRTNYEALLSTVKGIVVRTKQEPLYVQSAPVVRTTSTQRAPAPNDHSLAVKQPLLKTLDVTSTESINTTARARKETPYVVPSPKSDPTTCLVISFKTLKGVPHEDRTWDKIHFARNAAAAKKLLEVCGDFKTAERCLVSVYANLKEKGFPCSFETVVRHAHDWLARERKTDGDSCRKRLFDHLAHQRTAPGPTQAGADLPAGSVFNRFRNLQPVPPEDLNGHAGGGDAHGPALVRVREDSLEKPAD